MTTRTIRILALRNPAGDKDGGFLGYDFAWPDGTNAGLSFNCLCKIGLRAFFGKADPPQSARLALSYTPTWDVPRVKGLKRRRLIHRIGDDGVGRFLLQDESPTVMEFRPEDDPRVREWCGLAQGPGDHPFEFHAAWEDQPCSDPS